MTTIAALSLAVVIGAFAALAVWTLGLTDPQRRHLDPDDAATVARALSHTHPDVQVPTDPDLRRLAARLARRRQRVLVWLRPLVLIEAVGLIGLNVHLVMQGQWIRLGQIVLWGFLLIALLRLDRRLRRRLNQIVVALAPHRPPTLH